MCKKVIICILILITCESQAQDTANVTAKVQATQSYVEVSPSVNILYQTRPYLFTFKLLPKGKIGKIEFKGCQIKEKEGGFEVMALDVPWAVLTVYEKLPNGTQKIRLTKKYGIFKVPDPVIYIDDVRSDSTIEKLTLFTSGQVWARIPSSPKSQIIIKSFDLVYYHRDSNRNDTLHSNGTRLTKQMKEWVAQQEPGTMVELSNISLYILPQQVIRTKLKARVFLNHTRPRQFGG
jgi:hypothetical protein